ncbi:TPM domain-containing protein, partial [Kineococcus indalonis]|uniref:TPM domain-containing protein n=1 Tax=Kineococcus indalonis TaxID=2696566 RepID=UPI001411F8D0
MPRPLRRRDARRPVAAALLALGVLAGAGAAAVPAQAVPPSRLEQQVTDPAGVLGGADVRAALERLRAEHGVQLWVVLVDSFDGAGAQEWADATAVDSGLGVDDVLLAVATGDREYAYSVDAGNRLGDEDLAQVARDTEERLAQDDWAGAVVAGAESVGRALDGAGSGAGSGAGGGFPWGAAAVGGVVAAGAGGAVLLARSRRRARDGAGGGAPAGAPAGPPQEFAGTSTADLQRLADALLVRVDDAVRASAEELAFAAAEFGEQRTAEFAGVLQRARQALREAFTARQSLDDAEPETEEERRRVLAGVVADCRRVDETLDAAADGVDELRDLVRRAPEVLTGVEARLGELRAELGPERERLDAARGELGAEALAGVRDAPERAAGRLEEAQRSAAAARAALGDPARAGEVVDAVRAAQGALAQAEQLLASVGRTAQELRRAVAELPVALARL